MSWCEVAKMSEMGRLDPTSGHDAAVRRRETQRIRLSGETLRTPVPRNGPCLTPENFQCSEPAFAHAGAPDTPFKTQHAHARRRSSLRCSRAQAKPGFRARRNPV